MKSIFFFLFSTLICGIAFIGCNDDEEEHHHNHATFNWISPTEGAVFAKNDTVFMKGSFTGEESLHGYELSIINQSNADSVLFTKSVHDHALTLPFDGYWINNLDQASDLVCKLKVYLDHDGGFDTLNRSIRTQ